MNEMIRKALRLILFLLVSGSSALTYAGDDVPAPVQETEGKSLEVTLEADLVSHFIWRGLELAHISVQPTLGVSWKGLSLTAWGSVGFEADDLREIDLTAAYTYRGFSVGINNYWCDNPQANYFEYRNGKTNHTFEAFVSYECSFLRAFWGTIFAGADGVNGSGKRAYSSYFEISAPFLLATCDWEASVGFVPYTTDYYGTRGFAVTTASLKATKAIPITQKFELPLFAQLVANPYSRDFHFVVGLTLRPFQH